MFPQSDDFAGKSALVGERGAGALGVALDGELDEGGDEVGVGEPCGLPELGVHGDGGEAWEGIDLIEVDAATSVWLHEEVDAGEAGEVAGAECVDGHGADGFGLGGGELGGDDGDGALGEVFVLVIVELLAGDDFADDGGFGIVVAEDGDFELAGFLGSAGAAGAVDALLDDEFAVEFGGEGEGGREFLAVVCLGDADGGAEVGGFDEEGVFEVGLDAGDGFAGGGFPLGAEDGDVLDDGEFGCEEEALHGVFVHAGGGSEYAGADVGHVGELKESLDGAVFAEGSVEDGEDDIDGAGGAEGSGVAGEGADGSGGGRGDSFGGRFGGCGDGSAGEQGGGAGAGEPLAGLGDADGDDLEFFAVDCLEDRGGGFEGDFVFAGAPAEEDADTEFLSHQDDFRPDGWGGGWRGRHLLLRRRKSLPTRGLPGIVPVRLQVI